MFKGDGQHDFLPGGTGVEAGDLELEEKSLEQLQAELQEYKQKMMAIEAEIQERLKETSNAVSAEDAFVLEQSKEIREAEIIGFPVRTVEKTAQSNSLIRPEFLDEAFEKDQANQRILSFLEEEGVLRYQDGVAVFDFDKFENRVFSRKFFKLYLGRKEEGQIKGSKEIVYEIFNGQEVVPKKDFEQGKTESKFFEAIQEDRDLDKIRQRLVEKMTKEGFFREEDGYTVVDLEKFYQWRSQGDLGLVNGKKIRHNRINVYNFLKDFQVISEQDLLKSKAEGKDPVPKPLFNVPQSSDEVFDVEKIKKKDYYLNIWDINKSSNIIWDAGELRAKNGEPIDLKEFYLTTKIFRDFGGKRENGDLMVKDKKNNKYQKITVDWLEDNVRNLGSGKTGIKKGVHYFLSEDCPVLIKKGLIKYDDFRGQAGKGGEKFIRKELFPKEGKDFTTSFDSVRYYIAKGNYYYYKDEKIPLKNIKAVRLDDKSVGIISTFGKKEELKYVIDLLSEEEKEEKRKEVSLHYKEEHKRDLKPKEITARTILYKDEVEERTRVFSPTDVIAKKPGESDNEYAKRVSKISDYGHVKEVTRKFLKDCDISIHNLSWREQIWFCAAEYELGIQGEYDELVDFAKQYGLDGLRVFLSCESNLENAKKILRIGEKLAPEQAKKLFSKIVEFTDFVSRNEDELAREIFKDSGQRVNSGSKSILLTRANQMITEINHELVGKKIDNILVENLLNEIEGAKAETALLSAVLTSLKKDGEIIDLEKIKDLELAQKIKLEEGEIKEFVDLAKASWQENVKKNGVSQEFSDDLIKNLESSLRQMPNGEEVFMLRYKNELIGALRFKPIDNDTMEVKSVNVRSELKGLDVGKFMFELIHQKAQEKNLKLDVLLKNQVGTHYISALGFQGYGFNDNAGDADEPNIYAQLKKGQARMPGQIIEDKRNSDIEAEFDISEPKGLENLRGFLRDSLLEVNDQGEVVPGQSKNKKYTLLEYTRDKTKAGDLRRVLLRKNSLL